MSRSVNKAQHSFSLVPSIKTPRSVFNRSHKYMTGFNIGQLIPFFLDEILPGDTFALSAKIFARLNTLINPIMENIWVETFFFFVPCRLVWEHWKNFQGERTPDPDSSIDYTVPVFASCTIVENDVGDYFGLPIGSMSDTPISLPFRAYNLIYNEFFRSQDLQDSVQVDVDDGPDAYADYDTVLRRCKAHDYFTACLPYPQKGDTSVSLPLGSSAPVMGDGNCLGLEEGTNEFGMYVDSNEFMRASDDVYGQPLGTAATAGNTSQDDGVGVTVDADNSGLIADLSSATAATINSIRLAFQTQKLLERDARGGTRYIEILKSHFGVTSPDYRLQRPEYLGGGSQRMSIRTVEQTSVGEAAGVDTPVASLAGHGYCASARNGFVKSFTEHGYVIGLVNVRNEITYQQGMERMWSRSTRYDFYMPVFAHLGEQAVLNKEIYYNDGDGQNDNVFGYQERWAEYRYKPSKVTGHFRASHTDTLETYHMGLDFGSRPDLDAQFIQQPTTNMNRCFAVTMPDYPHILMDSFIQLKCARPMPVYSVPGYTDHF